MTNAKANQLEITKAEICDTKDLSIICPKTFKETYPSILNRDANNVEGYIHDHFSPKVLSSQISKPRNTFLLVSHCGQKCGYVKLVRNRQAKGLTVPKQINLEKIYLYKTFIGKGIGTELMEYVIDISRAEKFNLLWLLVWEHNPEAIKFYKKFGFQEHGLCDFEIGTSIYHDFLMIKYL